MFLDPLYFLMIAPALLLVFWAQMRVKSTYARAMQVDARLSGAAAARYLLDRAGLHDVGIEQTEGMLTDHYDPRHRVLRLSPEVYHSRSAAAVGIAAHEAGHALQHAHNYLPLVVRNAAVPAAVFGPWGAIILLVVGAMFAAGGTTLLGQVLVAAGLIAFGGVVFFQVVNLPVEFDASNRARQLLTEYQIVDGQGAAAVRSVLNAAAWTYVAVTLQAMLTLLYYALRFGGILRGND